MTTTYVDIAEKHDEEHVEEALKAGIDEIPYPDMLRAMAEAPSTETLKLAFELQVADIKLGLFRSLRKEWRMVLVCLPYIISTIGGGFDNGATGMVTAMPSFLLRFGIFDPESGWYSLSSKWVALWTSMLQLSIAFGAMLCIPLLEKFGPRTTNFIASILVLPAIALSACANAKGTLLVGKIIGGFPIGIFLASSSNFIAESTTSSLRAFTSTMINMLNLFGIALGLVTGFELIDVVSPEWRSWRLVYLVEFICPVITVIGLMFVPTSPVYLVKNGKPLDALKALRKLYGPVGDDELRARLALIQHTVAMEAQQKLSLGKPKFTDLWTDPIDRTRTLRTIGIWVCFNASGGAFLSNGLYFLEVMGLDVTTAGRISLSLMSISVAVNLVMGYVLTRFGRRLCFVYGNVIHTCVMLVLGSLGFASSHGAKMATAAFMQIGVTTVQISTGAPSYALNAELSSLRLRALTQSLGWGVCFLLQFGLVMAVPYIYQDPGWLLAKTALIFAGTSALAVVWGFFYIGETAGRTPEEIDALFEHRIPARRWKKTNVAELVAREPQEL